MKNKPMIRTLCHRCANDYRDAGYRLSKRGYQSVKEPCDICHVRPGLDYTVTPKERRAANGK